MKTLFKLAAAGVVAALIAGPAAADGHKVEIEFAYPYSGLFKETYAKIMKEFNKQHPNITVKFRASYENYEDGTNTILREAIADKLPDVTMQGLNRQAILVEKGIAQSLEPFIATEADFAKDGYHKAMLDLSTFDKQVYGLPFSVSTPIGYYNMDILKAAGISKIPTTWDEVITACEKIKKIGKDGMFWGWNITGNWFMQALMWSQDAPMIKNAKFNLDGEAGLNALNQMKKLFRGCGMKNYSIADGQTAFKSGKVGMMFWSTSSVGSVERDKTKDWTLQTAPFPGMLGMNAPKALPAGGNAAMFVSTSKDEKRRQAAWTFLKFITSGLGAAAVAETTGYVPPNKAANEMIGDFYAANPNKLTAVKQLPLLSTWFAYPGENGLAITKVIYDAQERIVVGDIDDMEELQEELVEEVNALMPKG
ncbi:MAG: ABC transporter substrate-binding protein [Pseudomonadota bacterium]|nr:ABC transporter substrate-binding protein [Pseudomonadota bacterium]